MFYNDELGIVPGSFFFQPFVFIKMPAGHFVFCDVRISSPSQRPLSLSMFVGTSVNGLVHPEKVVKGYDVAVQQFCFLCCKKIG